MNLFGIDIITLEDKYFPKKYVQDRYPASKCKRIKRKFAKKYGRWVPDPKLYVIDRRVLDDALRLDFSQPKFLDDERHLTDSLRYVWYWHGIDTLTGRRI